MPLWYTAGLIFSIVINICIVAALWIAHATEGWDTKKIARYTLFSWFLIPLWPVIALAGIGYGGYKLARIAFPPGPTDEEKQQLLDKELNRLDKEIEELVKCDIECNCYQCTLARGVDYKINQISLPSRIEWQ